MLNNDKIKKIESSYDEVPYVSKSFYSTQPIKLKTNLKLLNFDAPEISTANVLEIGCSFGGNIIPFALSYPKATVTGLDLSKTQINEGKKIIQHLGINNIKLLHENILEYETDEIFDYIICHGVYSWVPTEVQKGILEFIKTHLSKNGLAVISYNTYPGWKNMEIIKDAMLFRDKYLTQKGIEITSENKVSFGKGAIEFLKSYSQLNERVKVAIESVSQKNDYYILHEYYEDFNNPLYLYEFNDFLEKNGLKHIIDSNFTKSFPVFDNEIEEKLNNECGDNYIAREQYYDFLNDTQFRSSIITHKENINNINISKNINISNLKELHYRGSFQKNENGIYTIDNKPVNNEALTQILEFLTNTFPSTTTINKIEENFKDKIEPQFIYSTIMDLIYSNLIETFDNALVFKREEKLNILPRYKKYFEYFVLNEHAIIDLASRIGLVYDKNDYKLKLSVLISLFDGTRTDNEIVKELIEQEKKGIISVNFDEKSTLEDTLKTFVDELRDFIETNFFNTEI